MGYHIEGFFVVQSGDAFKTEAAVCNPLLFPREGPGMSSVFEKEMN